MRVTRTITTELCTVYACEAEVKALGMCGFHYQRHYHGRSLTGVELAEPTYTPEPEAIEELRVIDEREHIEWDDEFSAYIQPREYGRYGERHLTPEESRVYKAMGER